MTEEVLEYPYPLNLRWNHIQWYPVFFERMRRSKFWRLSDMEVRGVTFTLMGMAMDALPPATLPDDESYLALSLRLSPEKWADLARGEFPPLMGWRKVRCGKDIRLTHPVMLEALEIAVKAHKLRQRGTNQREMWTPPDAGRAPK